MPTYTSQGHPIPAGALTGPALLTVATLETLHSPSIHRADLATAAGYRETRPDGYERIHWTAFYGAILDARNGCQDHDGRPDWAAQPAGTIGASPRMLAWFATPEGEPIGPALPIAADRQGSRDTGNDHDERTLAMVQRWAQDHAAAILPAALIDNAAQGPTAVVMIADRSGTDHLLDVLCSRWDRPDGSARISWHVSHADSLPAGIETCQHCGALTTEGEAEAVNGETTCSACHDDAITCADCGERFTVDELTETSEGDLVCSDCRAESYALCPIDDVWVPDGDMVTVYGGGLWWNCNTRTSISRNAAQRLYEDCCLWLDCDGDYTAEEPEPYDDDEPQEGIGEGCRQYCYHTDPNDVLGVELPQTKHRHGAELEYKGPHPNGCILAEAMGSQAILTEDSTVTGEIVTACLTMGTLRSRLATIAGVLTGTRNDSTTGLHIHTDRQALTPWQWWGLIRYTQQHAADLATIAGRDSTTYGSFHHTVAMDWPAFVRAWKNSNGPRYVGWNITTETVELRVCRATKTPWRILARLAMLQRLLAIGRLPDSAKPDAEQLRGWLAQDPNIARQTGWNPGSWNYRDALKVKPQGPDLPPWERISEAEQRAATVLRLQVEAARLAYEWSAQKRNRAYNRFQRSPLCSVAKRVAQMHYHQADRIADRMYDNWRHLQRQHEQSTAEPLTH